MKKRKFTVEEQLAVVSELDGPTVSAVARKHGLDRKSVRLWKNQERDLTFVHGSRFRIPSGGRFVVAEELEFLLIERVKSQQAAGTRVTRAMIAHWAARWIEENPTPGLSLSNGWLEGFLERTSLVLRRVTSTPKLGAADVVERGVKFVAHVQKLIADYDIQYSNIYTMDETAVFLDHSRSTTVEECGKSDVLIKSFGFEKNRVTAVFAASTSGRKKPAMMVKGTTSAMDAKDGVVIMRGETSWMSSDWFTQWVDY